MTVALAFIGWGATFAISLPWIGRIAVFVGIALVLVFLGVPAFVSAREWYRDSVHGYPRLVWIAPKVCHQTMYKVQAPSAARIIGHVAPATSASVSSSQTTLYTSGFAAPAEYSEHADFGYAQVANDSTNRHKDAKAENAVAILEIRDVAGSLLVGPLNARWADSPNPALQDTFSSPAEYDTWHVGADKPEPIDVVYKFRDDDCCYVYTNANARGGMRDPKTQILQREFRAVVEVRCTNAPPTSAEFAVTHRGIGSVLMIERIV